MDENVAREIDDVLLKDSEKEDCLRKVRTCIGCVKGVRLVASSCDDTSHVLYCQTDLINRCRCKDINFT